VAEVKPKSIQLAEFKEEPLSSGRKLLHYIFKDKFGNSRYIWTPPWKGDSGVERLFLKAVEVEEWNDYDGVWSKELRQGAKEIPSLEEIKLPVKIRAGELTELKGVLKGQEGYYYKVSIDVLSDEVRAWKHEEKGEKHFSCIGDVRISWESLQSSLLNVVGIKGASKTVEEVGDWIENRSGYGDWEKIGVRFHVWLGSAEEKVKYEVIGREIVSHVRSFIRKRLSDFGALKKGFEEL
jgi:hypothetical protein